jgi:hypothetical protein
VQDGPELAGLDAALEVGPRGVEAAVVAEPERDPGRLAGGDGGLGLGLGGGEGLFAEDVLAGGRGRLDLLAVTGGGRGQDDGVHLRIGDHVLVAVEPEAAALGEGLVGLRALAGGGRDEAQGVAALDRVHQGPAPPAQADDTGSQHL